MPSAAEAPVVFTTPLTEQTCMESDTVTLKCEASRPNQPSVWHRNEQSMTPDETHLISMDGNVHRLTIMNASTDDAAEYACIIGAASTSGMLHVKGRSEHLSCVSLAHMHVCSPLTNSG